MTSLYTDNFHCMRDVERNSRHAESLNDTPMTVWPLLRFNMGAEMKSKRLRNAHAHTLSRV